MTTEYMVFTTTEVAALIRVAAELNSTEYTPVYAAAIMKAKAFHLSEDSIIKVVQG